jgi:hypothetical protein
MWRDQLDFVERALAAPVEPEMPVSSRRRGELALAS